eukprot:jgi/Chlat1/3040/Chrsp208S03290
MPCASIVIRRRGGVGVVVAARGQQNQQQQQQQQLVSLRTAAAVLLALLLLGPCSAPLAAAAAAVPAGVRRHASSAGRRLLLQQQQQQEGGGQQQQQQQQLQAEHVEAAACKRLDPDGDYSVWEAPSYGYWTRRLPHDQYLEAQPEQWRRKRYAGTGFWNARGLDTPGFIRAMLGDSLAMYETPIMTAVRLILLNRTDHIHKYLYPGDDDKWTPLAGENYARFFEWRLPHLLQQVEPVPGLSDAAAVCRARVFTDRSFLEMTRGDEGYVQASLWIPGYEEGHDTLYTTVWQQATISPFPYGPSSVTFYPDTEHRAINLRQWALEFRNHTAAPEPFGDCTDLGESQTPGYLPANMVAAYEIRDQAFRMYPKDNFDNNYPTFRAKSLPVAINVGMYKVFDMYMGLEHVLLVDGLVDPNDPTYCIEADAAGRLMVCNFVRMLQCDNDIHNAHTHHTILTDRLASVVGVIYATPAASGDTMSDAIANVRWCAAAQVLRLHTSRSSSLPEGYTAPAAARKAVEAAVFVDKTMKAQLLSVGESGWTDLATCHQVLQGVQSSGLGVQAFLPASSFAQRLEPDVLKQSQSALLDILSSSAHRQL